GLAKAKTLATQQGIADNTSLSTSEQAAAAASTSALQTSIEGYSDWGIKTSAEISKVQLAVNVGMSDATKAASQGGQDIGKGITDGVKVGIEANQQDIFSSLAEMAGNAIQAAKDALGIHSPSTAFAEVGMFSGQGWAQGVTQSADLVLSAVQDVANGSVSKAEMTAPSFARPPYNGLLPIAGGMGSSVRTGVQQTIINFNVDGKLFTQHLTDGQNKITNNKIGAGIYIG
ncbi:MAG: hypothetical protein WCS37_21665, partial [Chloroflexota bacterium]